MKSFFNQKKVRYFIALVIPLTAILLLIYVYHRGSPLFCFFHHLTGLYCFGCGSGRALTALLHFDFVLAIKNNLFILFAFPYLGYQLSVIYINYVLGKEKFKLLVLSSRFFYFLVFFLIVFVILRNIPLDIFEFLRPVE